jgi:hypothetical protein
MSDLETLPRERLERMLAAGREARECMRVLRKAKANVVSEVLKGQGKFYEYDHFPKGDVYDADTHAQYYYHAHRKESGEHGHFHTFLRMKGMPPGVEPIDHPDRERWPLGARALAHLVAVSMDRHGNPTHLFTTNRWVTGEAWYRGEDVVAMLGRFAIDHAYPSWPTNRWLTAMLVLFRPEIETLIEERDRAVAEWSARHPDRDVFQDKELEITSIRPVSIDEQIARIERALAGNAAPAPLAASG